MRIGRSRRESGVTTHLAMAESADHAYERAFAEHWSDVFRFALAWTNDWSAAEDLAQEAFLRLWDRRGRLDWDRPVMPWLLVTTRRLATDRFRRLRRSLGGSIAGEPADPGTSDEATHDRWLDVAAAMAVLSPLERAALVLTALDGMTYDETAALLATSAGRCVPR